MNSASPPRSSEVFVGRSAELNLLQTLWEEARSGAGRFVLIGGEAGIGKSRLLQEFSTWANAANVVVASAAAFENEAAHGFQPIRDLLRSLLRTARHGAHSDLQTASNALATASDGERETDQRRLRFDQVLEALDVASKDNSGCLLLLEDLHWADESSLSLLAHIARRMSNLRVLIVATHRTMNHLDNAGFLALSAEIRRLPSGVRLNMQPFTAVESTAFVTALAGDKLQDEDIRLLIQRSDGNPLFLEELIREAVTNVGRRSRVPAAVADLVLDRLARLSSSAQGVGHAAAVLADFARLDLVANLAGVSEESTARDVDELVNTGILDAIDSRRLQFHHALVREAVYQSIPLVQRTALHLQAASLLEARPGTEAVAGTIANHLRAAGTRDSLFRAADLYLLAAQQSLDVLAFEDAASQLSTATALLDDLGDARPESRLRAIFLKAEIHRRVGEATEALNAFREAAIAARRNGQFNAEAVAALGYERTFLATGRPRSDPDAFSVPMLTRAIEDLEETIETAGLRARLLAALAQALFFGEEVGRAQECAEEARKLAVASADPLAEASALQARRVVYWTPDDPNNRLAITREIVGLATRMDDGELVGEALYWQVSASLEMGYVRAAGRDIDQFARIANQLQNLRRRSEALRMMGMFAFIQGHQEEALALAEQAFRLADQAGFDEGPIHHVAQLIEFEADEELIRGAVEELTRDLKPRSLSAMRRGMMAFLSWKVGRDEDSRELLAGLATTKLREISRDWMWLPIMHLICQTIAGVGQTDWAAYGYDLMLPYADQFIVNSNTAFYGSVEYTLGIASSLIDPDVAAGHLKRSIKQNEAIGAPIWTARSREALGRLLVQSGHETDGLSYLEAAITDFTKLAMPLAARRVLAILPQHDAGEVGTGRPGHLTEREVEVLRLIASGASNLEMAERLYLSIRTVERHITNLYAKIGAHGKADATAFALRNHLVD